MLKNYYTPSMEGSLADQQILRALMAEYIPDIDSKFRKLDVPIAIITLPWFLCLFVQCVPLDVNLRILDLFFAFGRVVLFQIALGIFTLLENEIHQATDSMEIIFSIKDNIQNLNSDDIIKASLTFSAVTSEKIDQLWAEHYPLVLKEIDAHSPAHTDSPINDTVIDHQVETAVSSYNSEPQVTFKRRYSCFPQSPSFRLQSNEHIRKTLQQAPEISHSTASLICLIRDGFTGQAISDEQ